MINNGKKEWFKASAPYVIIVMMIIIEYVFAYNNRISAMV